MFAIAYAHSPSTPAKSEGGLDVREQLAIARTAISGRGWELASEAVDEKTRNSTPLLHRPALSEALSVLDDGRADVLVVATLNSVSHRVANWAELVRRNFANHWRILVAQQEMEISPDHPEALAEIVATLAEQERELRSSRARSSLAAAKAKGTRIGRPPEHSEAVCYLVQEMRHGGNTLAEIAEALNSAKIRTPRDKKWHPSTVQAILNTVGYEKVAQDKFGKYAVVLLDAIAEKVRAADAIGADVKFEGPHHGEPGIVSMVTAPEPDEHGILEIVLYSMPRQPENNAQLIPASLEDLRRLRRLKEEGGLLSWEDHFRQLMDSVQREEDSFRQLMDSVQREDDSLRQEEDRLQR